ncbi:hypothetical protein ACFLYA_01250 [Candidatus Dependentiae bacterium]
MKTSSKILATLILVSTLSSHAAWFGGVKNFFKGDPKNTSIEYLSKNFWGKKIDKAVTEGCITATIVEIYKETIQKKIIKLLGFKKGEQEAKEANAIKGMADTVKQAKEAGASKKKIIAANAVLRAKLNNALDKIIASKKKNKKSKK